MAIVHFCYFQNTFPFVSTFRQTNVVQKMARVCVLTMKFPRMTKIGQCQLRACAQLGPGPSLPLPAGLGPPECSTGPSTLNTFTLPTFLPGRTRPRLSPLDLW